MTCLHPIGHTEAGRASFITGDVFDVLATTTTTIGWTDCGHGDTWRPGIVLDPFGGSGTTLAVATGRGHHAIGIDLDPRNVALARDRVGPLMLDEFSLDEWKAHVSDGQSRHDDPTRGALLAQGPEGRA